MFWYLTFWSKLTSFLVTFLLHPFGDLYKRSLEGFIIAMMSTSTASRSAWCTFGPPFWATSHKRLASDRLRVQEIVLLCGLSRFLHSWFGCNTTRTVTISLVDRYCAHMPGRAYCRFQAISAWWSLLTFRIRILTPPDPLGWFGCYKNVWAPEWGHDVTMTFMV